MRKLLVLFAFILMIYYVRASAATVVSKEWINCANAAMELELTKARDRQSDFMHDMCTFYNKPQKECYQILADASKEEVNYIIAQYYRHGIVIPQCGTPK
jgi:hypothetical protein